MDLRLFLEDVASGAGAITLRYFRDPSLEVVRKGDTSPVTRADREAEQYIRGRIREHFPSDVILGEEFGTDGTRMSHRWILDPIDGTKSFIHGVPLYGVMIALEVDGIVTHGVVHLPALGETVSAARGEGCYWNGTRCHTSKAASVRESLLCTTSPGRLEEVLGHETYQRVTNAFSVYRGWGDCYGHVLVATGRADAMLDPRMAIWDAAPLGVIVEEAGGISTDLTGRHTIEGGSLLSCAPGIAGELAALLRHDA